MAPVNEGQARASGLWSQTLLVLAKDLAFDPDRGLLPRLGPGIFWVCVLLAALLAIGRSFAIERDNRAGTGLLLSGVDPAAMFLGKTLALMAELLVLEMVLAIAMAVMYDIAAGSLVLLSAGAVLASAGIAGAGTLYGALSLTGRSRDSLLAILLLPVL